MTFDLWEGAWHCSLALSTAAHVETLARLHAYEQVLRQGVLEDFVNAVPFTWLHLNFCVQREKNVYMYMYMYMIDLFCKKLCFNEK